MRKVGREYGGYLGCAWMPHGYSCNAIKGSFCLYRDYNNYMTSGHLFQTSELDLSRTCKWVVRLRRHICNKGRILCLFGCLGVVGVLWVGVGVWNVGESV